MSPTVILTIATAGMFFLLPKRPPGTASRADNLTFGSNPQTTKSPSSAQSPRQNQGSQANQPWYTGPLTAGAGILAVSVASSLADMFSSSGDDVEDYPDDVEEGMAAWGDGEEADTSDFDVSFEEEIVGDDASYG